MFTVYFLTYCQAFQLKTIGVLTVLLFMNSQFIIAKSNYYDRDHITQVMEMYGETLLSLYYLPKSAFFYSFSGDTSQTKVTAD